MRREDDISPYLKRPLRSLDEVLRQPAAVEHGLHLRTHDPECFLPVWENAEGDFSEAYLAWEERNTGQYLPAAPGNLRDLVDRLDPSTRTAVTIGVFDGVHLGHQAVIDEVWSPHRVNVEFRALAPVARYARGTFSADLDLSGSLARNMTPVLDVLDGEGSLQTSRIAIEGFPLLERLSDALRFPDLGHPTLERVGTNGWWR